MTNLHRNKLTLQSSFGPFTFMFCTSYHCFGQINRHPSTVMWGQLSIEFLFLDVVDKSAGGVDKFNTISTVW